MNAEVYREPVNPQQLQQEIDDLFVFNRPMTQENATSCARVQQGCKLLANLVLQEVPEGRERSIALNSILSIALLSSHGITRRQVAILAATPLPEEQPGECPAPTGSTSPASPSPTESPAT